MPARPQAAVLVFGLDPRRIGGIEVHTREVVAQLAERGCLVVLCFPETPSSAVLQYLSLPNIRWEKMSHPGENTWRSSWRLLWIIRKYRPGLLHLQFTPMLSFAGWIARLNGVKKVVFTDHHSRPEGFVAAGQPAWKQAMARVLQFPVSAAVAVSDHNPRIIAGSGTYRASRVRRIYNGVDLLRPKGAPGAAFRERYGIPAERILITQVAQMKREKGVDDILEAAPLALAQQPNLHFAFVGDGQSAGRYAARARELGIQDHVTWTGLSVDPRAEGVFAASDIFCHPSRWQEAFGLVLAEAMSCGKPIVATTVGGIPEVVEDGKTGFLVPPGDLAALAGKLVWLARDAALRERMGRAGRERVVARFDVRAVTQELMEVYGDF
jgi:glycosyltransferase involved in cell wall biosynthesis